MTPASKEGERGYRQAGGKGRVETVWSHAATMGSTGRNAQPGGCSGCCGPLSGVRTARCMHLLHSTCPVQYHTTVRRPASIYYSPLSWAEASISAQVGWRATAMTKTERGRQERDVRQLGQVLRTCCVGACGTPCCPPRKCRLTLQMQSTVHGVPGSLHTNWEGLRDT